MLFVCLGNICRSPTAEAMFRAVCEREGVAGAFDIDSCGTGGGASGWDKPGGFSYHEGDAADPRMTAAAARRGVRLTSRSRPLKAEDFSRFKYIVGMDASNIRSILTAADFWRAQQGGGGGSGSGGDGSGAGAVPPAEEAKAQVTLMTDYCTQFKGAREVPE